jgi:outer membrane receptor protein involved in Fe transport
VPSFAQSVPSLPSETATTAPAGEEILELSPFEVTTSADVGYLANNSLAGSRFNTRLKDTPASISVMTREFLDDIGAFALEDALVFANNLQINLEDQGSIGDSPGGNSATEFSGSYRVRGINATVARNYFRDLGSLPRDTYNVERIEDSRGPNSVLFGLGSAGGVINVATKQAKLSKDSYAVLLSAGRWDSWRAAVDVNQVLIDKKLAFRVNALVDDSNKFRYHTGSESKAVHLAAKYLLTPKTQLRVEWERQDVEAGAARSWIFFDYATPWYLAGSPALTSANSALRVEPFTTNRPVYFEDSRTVINTQNTLETRGTTELENIPIANRSLYSSRINAGGPGAVQETEGTTYAAYLEQKLGKNTFVELAYNHQESDFSSFDPRIAHWFKGDPNANLPGGLGANPNAGQLYVETQWRNFTRAEESDTARLTFATQVDAGKWGAYRFGLMGEYEETGYEGRTYEEIWRSSNTAVRNGLISANPENAANYAYRRRYVSMDDPENYYTQGPHITGLIKGVVDRRNPSLTYSSEWAPTQPRLADTEGTSGLLSVQGSWLKGRIVAGGGYRYDRLKSVQAQNRRNATTNAWEVNSALSDTTVDTGRTYTAGVVFHITEKFSLLYNQADNIAITDPRIMVLPNVARAKPSAGEGRDIGVQFDLMEGKLFARAVYYETAARGEVRFAHTGTDGPVPTSSAVLSGLEAAGLITTAEGDRRDISLLTGGLSDRESEGYELSLTANPIRGLRLQMSWSITDNIQNNIDPEVVAWWNETKAFYLRFPGTTPTGSGASAKTLTAEIAEFEGYLQNLKSVEGVGGIGNRKHKANFTARYTLQSGPAKGLFVGGGYRYHGKMLTGRTNQNAATPNELQWAAPVGEGNFFTGYSFRPYRRHVLKVQLNISNLFDETDPIVTRYHAEGDTKRVRRNIERMPRMWRLTADYSF